MHTFRKQKGIVATGMARGPAYPDRATYDYPSGHTQNQQLIKQNILAILILFGCTF